MRTRRLGHRPVGVRVVARVGTRREVAACRPALDNTNRQVNSDAMEDRSTSASCLPTPAMVTKRLSPLPPKAACPWHDGASPPRFSSNRRARRGLASAGGHPSNGGFPATAPVEVARSPSRVPRVCSWFGKLPAWSHVSKRERAAELLSAAHHRHAPAAVRALERR
jgi:hypothetical protein